MTGAAVRRLTVTEFRSYAFARLELSAMPVVLAGPNGAGKTNLLEAVSLLVPGRGLRRARLTELPRRSSNGPWGISAHLESVAGGVEIGTGSDGTAAEGSARRLVRINGLPVRSQAALADYASAVWLTPQMDRIFLEGAGERRRFLDRLVFGLDPAHAARTTAYDNALRQRSRLLREGPRDAAWVRALEETMASAGVTIAAARRSFADRLNRSIGAIDSGFPRAHLQLSGGVDALLADMPGEAAEGRVCDALAASRARDGESGGASIGPHRSDLVVTDLECGQPASHGSTGEQKALLVSLVLATARLQAAERGTAPLILLDEVAAHLDAGRRRALFDEIAALGAQAWITGTEVEIFTPFGRRAQFFAVQNGTLTPI